MNLQQILLLCVLIPLCSAAQLPSLPAGKAVKQPQSKAAAARFMPRISGNSIICGNKRLSFDLDGKIRFIADGVNVGDLYCYYSVEHKATKKVKWGGFDKSVSSLKRKGDTFEWQLCRQVGKETWKGAEQKVSITPGGLVKVEFTHLKFDHAELKLRDPRGSLWFILKNKLASGSKHTFNNIPFAIPEKGRYPLDYTADKKNLNVTFFAGDPAREIKILCGKDTVYHLIATTYPALKESRFTYMLQPGKTAVLYIDLRAGVKAQRSNELRAGIDFKKIEDLELPDGSRRNLLPNSSFERGLECFRLRHSNTNFRWGWKSYKVQSKEKYAGNNALEFYALRAKQYPSDDFRRLGCTHNVTTATLILEPGTYTFSLFAKCTPGEKALVNVWIPNYFKGSIYYTNDRSHIGKFPVSDKWGRKSYTFKLDRTRPVEFHINAACLGKGDCNVWIDALQLEKGSRATAYDAPAAEGRLLTSEKENFINAPDPVKGRLLITTTRPNMKGSAAVRIKNFFGEILLKEKYSFKTNSKGTAEVKLPLDQLPGLGIFMVRADYTLSDGSKSFDHHRYTRVRYLDNSNPLSRIFCFHYNKPELSSDYPEVLARWQKVGVGSKLYNYTYTKEVFDLEKKYNVVPGYAYLFQYPRENGKRFNTFAIIDTPYQSSDLQVTDPRILVRDHKAESNGCPTPEYLEKFKNAVRKMVAKYPHVPMWLPEGEGIARFPVEWWSKKGTAEECAKIRALIFKAFVEGVHLGNPKALAAQDAPCNMRPEGGIAETDMLLAEANKLGYKFDVIGIHPYRAKPENPDLDADTMRLFKMLDKRGYSKTQVVWSEMMHWGPYTIPQLDIDFKRFGSGAAWFGGFLSYDISKHEKISASFYARSWLVALKYADRIYGATAGNQHNNCFMDMLMTPYAAQLIPNTLNYLLGNSTFKADIRFAPYIRTFLFEDAQKRPVAAIWCHREQVDDGESDAPVAEADFGNALEGVFDLMNSPRAFTAGKFRFPVSGFPIFLRGKPGTLAQFKKALSGASIISGDGISPIDVLVQPHSLKELRVTLINHSTVPFKGSLNGQKVRIPASGKTRLTLPMPRKLAADQLSRVNMMLVLKGDNGSLYKFPQNFEVFTSSQLPENVTFNNINWQKLPAVKITGKWKNPKTSGSLRTAWNRHGLFLQVQVKDSKFCHVEYPVPVNRWKNDCLQIYFDTLGDARIKPNVYDENDSAFAIFPNAAGNKGAFYVNRPVDQQLGLGGQSPKFNSFVPAIPCRFKNQNGVLTYETFIPAPYLLPIKLKTGYSFGFSLFAPDSNAPDTIDGALSLTGNGMPPSNRPHLWPTLLLHNSSR